MAYPVQWPQGTSPTWLLGIIRKMEGLVIRSRDEAESSIVHGESHLQVLTAWNELGGHIESLENGLGGTANVSIFLLAVIHNMLDQDCVDIRKLTKDLKFVAPQKRIEANSVHSLSMFDLFLDNAERDG